MLFRQFAIKWYEVDYYRSVRASTFKNRRFYLDKHILPFLGDRYLHEITGDVINEFYAELKRKGYAPKTISSIHKFLSRLLKSSVKKGYIEVHPMEELELSPRSH
ncbi:phage integrase SAM-like domain-containing protein [Alkalihalobacterium chitinilyticum]|uniref:phage integrase SAM-like domain-containing protein n=1 Tax=Alkalihalobacterium chitinilyticum TaxID=2980103 RepID=UPI003570B141